MLNAHLDTVGVAGYDDPFVPRFVDGRCHGRGALDTKAGLVAAMRATAAAAGMGLAGDVIFTGVVDEEAGSKGTEAVVRSGLTADGAIVVEPTGLEVVIGHRGFAWGRVTVDGFAAHGSAADVGVDAIAHAGVVLTSVRALHERLQAARPDAVIGHGAVHAAVISGGQEISSYPARCVVDLERRLLPSETVADWEEELAALCAMVEAPATARFEVPFSRAGLRVAEDEPIVAALVAAATGVLGAAPSIGSAPYWTDAALLNEAGIPAVIFGPGGEGLHGHDEWVDLATMDATERTLTAAVGLWCGT